MQHACVERGAVLRAARTLNPVALGVRPRLASQAVRLVAAQLDASPHLEFHLLWARALLVAHGGALGGGGAAAAAAGGGAAAARRAALAAALRGLHKAAAARHEALARLCAENQYALAFLADAPDDDDEAAAGAAASAGDAAGEPGGARAGSDAE
jgi:hypothetical protein